MNEEELPEGAAEEETADRREQPRTGATVIRLRQGKLEVEACAPLLVRYAGLHRPDAAAVCARAGGMLADNLDPAQASALVAALQALGEPCFAVPAAEVVPLPRAVPIHAAQLSPTDLGPLDTVGRPQEAPWEKAIALVLAAVPVVEAQRKVVHHRAPLGGMALAGAVGFGLAGAVAGKALDRALGTEQRTVSKTDRHVWLDVVFLHPLRRYRIESGKFDYSVLGKQLATTGANNVQTLARRFLAYAPHVRTNVNAAELHKLGSLPLPHLPEKAFNETVHWLINLARFGKEAV
jgi:hypothetical protein